MNDMFVPVLYSYTYNDKQGRTVFNEFIMGNKHNVLGSKANYGDLGAKPEAIGDLGTEPPMLDFVLFKIQHSESYLSLNFYKNLSVSISHYYKVHSSDK